MRTRHRIPTVFNISMVDMLCCSLGCVILLWLLNLREAQDRALEASQSGDRLVTVQGLLDQAQEHLRQVTSDRDAARLQAENLQNQRDQTRRELTSAEAKLESLERKLADLLEQNTDARARIRTMTAEQRTLQREKESAAARLARLERVLRDQDSQSQSSTKRLEALQTEVRDAQAKLAKLQEEVQDYRTRLLAAETREKALNMSGGDKQRDLDEASRNVELLQREKKTLLDRLNRVKQDAENRFEGIALGGKRAMFMVDMSGSMELVDEKTPDPKKWLGVRETLAKILRSLPDLEKFQVIVFSEKATFLLGEPGAWLDFDPKTSIDRAVAGLAAVTPKGATNMYDAFEAAFRYRPLGLDTIYVLSDGLPNVGPGLTPQQDATLTKETDRAEILARHIRNLLRNDWNRPIQGQPRVKIQTIGFFYESPDVGAFLWALARENDGSFVGMSKP